MPETRVPGRPFSAKLWPRSRPAACNSTCNSSFYKGRICKMVVCGLSSPF